MITHHCQHQAPIISSVISKAERHFMVDTDIIILLQYIILLQSCYFIFTDAINSFFQYNIIYCMFSMYDETKWINTIVCYLQAKIIWGETHFEEFSSYNTENHSSQNKQPSCPDRRTVDWHYKKLLHGAFLNISASATNSFWHMKLI